MSNSSNTCTLYPEAPNGEPSRMYRDLLKRLQNRPLVNYIYAVYKTNHTAENMDKAGMERNLQNEHYMEDVIKFMDIDRMTGELGHITTAKIDIGATDASGNIIEYADAEDALKRADKCNNKYKGLVATVVPHDDTCNIIVDEKNAKTHTYADSVKERLQIWDMYKQVFNGVGVDITSLPQELRDIISPLQPNLAQYLKDIRNTTIDNIYRRNALVLFSLSPDSQAIKNIVTEFGSIENAAQAIDDFNHGSINLSAPQQRLLVRAVKEAKKYQGLDLDAMIDQVRQMSKTISMSSPEQEVKTKIKELNQKFGIGKNEIHRISDKIFTLSDAAEEAAFQIKRRIRELEKIKGNNTEGKRLENILNSLMKELACKKYYFGVMKFLGEASSQVAQVDKMLQDSQQQTGTEIEKAFGTAKIIQNIKTIRDQYYDVLKALANENLAIDESISKTDIENIRKTSRQLRDFFDKTDMTVSKYTEDAMISLMTNIIGKTTPDGQSIINAVKMAAKDSTRFDYLYSMGRASNPVVAAMGKILRNAQDSRDGKINEISRRIRVANDKLSRAGYNTEFMYEDEGHLASDIDWASYETARTAQIKFLYAQGFRGFELKQEIEDWEDQNTEDRVVDAVNGRTERVPNGNYHKQENFQEGWSQEQKDYYNTMMQLKGEIGSLLPAYAQKQYLPPQVRRKFLDALHDAHSIGDVTRAIGKKFGNIYKIREDDENYSRNGIIDGNEYQITDSDYDNKALRQIPIFYVNRVEQGELLRNFSTGITALASTAINYNALNNVVDVVEFIGDFAKNKNTASKDSQADLLNSKEVSVFKDLWDRAISTNTNALVEGFIAQHIYGQKRSSSNPKLNKVMDNILAYTSFKGLSTNLKGAFANWGMGELQMLLEAGCGEFYGKWDYAWANAKLFGGAGFGGDIMELLTNNVNHKSVLFREMFDPLEDNFAQKSHKRYYSSWFRQLMSHDCSFIGYSSGEYIIHYVNMYAILHSKKNHVMLNGKEISLYEAFEVVKTSDHNSELKLKNGVTDKNGNPITQDFLDKIRKKIRYVNQTCHGSMNEEDKGIIHQKMWGRLIMNFRQWMPEHYSRRFRSRHYDATLGEYREGYYTTLYKATFGEERVAEAWQNHQKMKALGLLLKDLYTFTFRSTSQWNNFDDGQKYNIKRVRAEFLMFFSLLGLSFALGEPDEHKKEFQRRWWIYQTKRALMDTEAAMPNPKMIHSFVGILQSPMASVNTFNSLMYAIYGLTNGDLFKTVKSGPWEGWNKYVKNTLYYNAPFIKDYIQLKNMDEDDTIFKVFDLSPTNH